MEKRRGSATAIVLGAVFLRLATSHIGPHETEKALREMDLKWLAAGVASYLAAIALRCLRWGILVRAVGSVNGGTPSDEF
ncbi:MAG: flippase-like domain-containing protein [Gammaproteobacteria bacterium]|nr:flippase-like domain-containing protein [Gammaproteobacteria bacterium]